MYDNRVYRDVKLENKLIIKPDSTKNVNKRSKTDKIILNLAISMNFTNFV